MNYQKLFYWGIGMTLYLFLLVGCDTPSPSTQQKLTSPSPTLVPPIQTLITPTFPPSTPTYTQLTATLVPPTVTQIAPTVTVSFPPNPVVYQNPQNYQVTYIISVYNKDFKMDKLLVYQPRPVEWDAQENVKIEKVFPPPTHEGVDPIFGNGIYHWFRESEPTPGERQDFEMVFTFTAYETETEIDTELVQDYRQDDAIYELYTKTERFIEVTDPQIIELANQIAEDETNPYLLARKYYNYVIDNSHYKILGEGLRGAMALVDTGIGECGDYASLFIALCRAAGIPARPVVGYWAISGIEQTHVWAEFYLEPFGWIPADPTIGQLKPSQRDYYFGNMDNQRVILNKGFNIQLDPPGPNNHVATFLQVPLWWFWGSGDADGTYLEPTTWVVEKLP